MIEKIIKFIKEDIWRIRVKNFSPAKGWLIKQFRVVLVAIKGYQEDKCKFRASALTFFTLLSIVPILALLFGIAKGFGVEQMIADLILEKVQQQPQFEEIAKKTIAFSTNLLERTKGGVVAGIGIAILFLTVIRVLGNIENAFNFIWGIKKPRSLQRKFADYLSVMLVCPLLLVLSSSANIYVVGKVESITAQLQFMAGVRPYILFGLRFLPYVSLWLVFSFIFCFMPNTKVRLSSAVLAGIVAGTLFQLTQIVYIKFQVGVTRYNEIYGSFAALPLFLIWLQLSWFIVLFGAEVSFAHQNIETFEMEPDCLNASKGFRKKIGILITSLIAKNFDQGLPAITAAEINKQLDLPIRLVRELLFELTSAGILAETVVDDGGDPGYQPAKPIDKLTMVDVVTAIETKGLSQLDFARSEKIEKISKGFDQMQKQAKDHPANILVKDI